ncbi:MAG: LptF/LptG family permease [Gemmatimonadaceae bacterium]|nr:LptF/LptG family permease [Gemmatimonadaceae bacterium]
MKLLTRYILREQFGPLVFALSSLTALLLLQQVAKQFGNLVGKGLGWDVIGEFFLLSIPFIIAMTMPMGVLVAVLYAFSRLTSENEITALRASGISVMRLVRPAILFGATLGLLMLVFNDQVLPRSNHRLRTLQTDIARKKPTFALREQVINEVMPGKLFLRTSHIDESTDRMREVTIYNFDDPERRKTIYSDSGKMGMTPDQKDLQMTLHDGYMQQIPRDNLGELTRLYFRTDLVRVRGVGNRFEQTEKDDYKSEREMSVCEMAKGLEDANQDLDQARATLANTLVAATHYLATGEQIAAVKVPKPKVRMTTGGLYCKLVMPIFGNAAIADTDTTVTAPKKSTIAAAGAKGASVAVATPAPATPVKPETTAVAAAIPPSAGGGVANGGFRAPPSSGAARMPQFGAPGQAPVRGGFRAPPAKPVAKGKAAAKGNRSPKGAPEKIYPPSSAMAQGIGVAPSSGLTPTTAAEAIRRQQDAAKAIPQLPGANGAHGRGFDAPANAPSPFTSPAYLLSSAAQIEVMKARVHDSEVTMSRYSVEIQKKFALAAACVVFVLLGAPIGIRFPRGGVGLVIGVSIAVFALYYVGLIVGEDLANKLILDPVIAMWMANALFTVVGVFGIIRVQRSGGSARGGDASELFDTVRSWVAKHVRRVGTRADRRSRVPA